MSEDNQAARFAGRFLASQRAKGRDLGPLYGVLEGMAGTQGDTTAPTGEAWMLSSEEIDKLAEQPTPAKCRTVQDFTRDIHTRRPAPDAEPPAPRIQFNFNPTETLTACLDTAEQPETARRIFRVLFELALQSVRARGLPGRPNVAVFHLPVDLLASHLGVDRTTIYRNLQPLMRSGVVDARDHYDSLKGHTAITGKVWAVSLAPEQVLGGQLLHVRVRAADLRFPWRDLTRDVEQGRTAYAMTRTPERIEREQAQREAAKREKAEERAQAQARAQQRAAERQAARARGEVVLTGRKAAAANAAQTRTEKPRPTRPKARVQQSREGLKAVDRAQLLGWVLAPFSRSEDVTMTVARDFSSGLDAVFSLPSLAALSKAERNAAVEETARTLAAAFEDTHNLRFWCWLLWRLIQGVAQGQNYMDDVAYLLARVLNDLRHDETMYARTLDTPAALIVNQLRNSGILDALRELKRHRVGGMPSRPAAA